MAYFDIQSEFSFSLQMVSTIVVLFLAKHVVRVITFPGITRDLPKKVNHFKSYPGRFVFASFPKFKRVEY